MLAVMSEREIDLKSAAESSSDLPYMAFEARREESRPPFSVVPALPHGEPAEPRVSPVLDLGPHEVDRRARILDDGERDGSGSSALRSGDLEMRMDLAARVSDSAGLDARYRLFDFESESYELSREPSGIWMHGLEIGDMVWGKVKSHPWWPGHIFNESFASPSVRRTKREGHVLVAFFGDSSYGWFDPAELIPFDPHYAEKSKQTTLRTFVKAVEEATDEASRRGALGLTCRCRSPCNFRAMSVPGYFAVDVVGYEPGGIYSSKQIEKARDCFSPIGTLSFVLQLAVTPRRERDESGDDIGWTKSMAVMLAFRKAVFEEFDDTYAQAFGVQPVRPSPNDIGVPRATLLCGSQVFAETLSDKKKSIISGSPAPPRPAKIAASKKNKYEFKRREDPASQFHGTAFPHFTNIPRQQEQLQQSLQYLPQSQTTDAAREAAQVGDFVLQKRFPSNPAAYPQQQHQQQHQHPVLVRQDGGKEEEKDAMPEAKPPPPPSSTNQQGSNAPASSIHEWSSKVEPKPVDSFVSIDSGKPVMATTTMDSSSDVKEGAGPGTTNAFTAPAAGQAVAGMGGEALATYHAPVTVIPQLKMAQEAKFPAGAKKKVPKRRREDVHVLPDDTMEAKKKKKKKKDSTSSESVPELWQKRAIVVGATQAEPGHTDPQRKEGAIPAFQLPKVDANSMSVDFPQVITDLSELAIDPFYGSELNVPSVVSHVVLKFRSLVYQKSLVLQLASEPDAPLENRTTNLIAVAANAETGVRKEQRDSSSSLNPSRPSLRPDDPTKSGRKRGPSDRQEEMSAKKMKKINQLKALAKEKKAGLVHRTSSAEGKVQDPKEAASASASAAPLTKMDKPDIIIKKKEPPPPPPPKVVSPTFLVMKFPPRTTLPSIASLKARFARFGPLDISACRVYWKSYTCKVLFKYRADAVAAYSHAGSNDIFGQIKVNYSIRELEAPAPEPAAPEPIKRPPELKPAQGAVAFRPGNGNGNGNGNGGGSLSLPRPPFLPQRQQQPSNLKSILKKPTDDMAALPSGTVAKESQRVKFMLDGEDDRNEPPPVVVASDNAGATRPEQQPYTVPPMEPLSSKPKSVNFLPPTPPSMARPAFSNPAPFQQPSRSHDVHNLPPTPAPPRGHDTYESRSSGMSRAAAETSSEEGRSRSNAEISRQMLSLLHRCNDIVSNLKGSLGYVPYHPI